MKGRQAMNARGRRKRLSAILLAAALTLSTATGAIPAEPAAAGSVTYQAARIGARVLPAQAAGNDSFLSAYVLQERLGTFHSNGLFHKTGSHNLKGGTDTLSRTTKYWHNSNDYWSVEYRWDFNGAPVQKYWNAGGLALNVSANLYSDYHSNLWEHTDKLWDRVELTISGVNAGGETLLLDKLSAKESDEKAQPYQGSARPGGNQNTGVKFWAGSYNCNCGSSGIGDAVVYLVDQAAPTVTQVYAASDREGETPLAADKGLPAGETVYFILDFSEDIRFADNQATPLSLALGCAWRESDQSVATPLTADLVSLVGSRMVFQLTVPEKLENKPTDIYVDSISTQQDWVGKSGFSWTLLDENGAPFAVQDGILDSISSRITDLAGNPVNWTDSKKTLSERAYLDDVSPALKQVTISGRNIKAASEVEKTQDGGWPADVDLSAVYAATGDQLTFGVWYTERLTGLDVTGVQATLNLQRGGSPVTLNATQLLTVTGKTAFGVDAGSGYVSQLVFEPLTLAEGMTLPGDDPIRIVEITGMDAATDIAGHPLVQEDIPAPRQQQYLDVMAPVVETDTSMAGPDGDGYYSPLGGAGHRFTIPVKISDVGSGCMGLTGRFKLDGVGSSHYFWYVDTDPNYTRQNHENYGFGYQWQKFTQLSDAETSYIHIRLPQGVGYLQPDGTFQGGVQVEAVDYAGNTTTANFLLRHQTDQFAPTVKSVSYTPTVASAGGTDYDVTMKVEVQVTDAVGIDSIRYYWEDDQDNAQTVNPGEKTHTISVERTDTVSLGGAELSGSRTLHVTVTDTAGNSQSWSQAYPYEVGRGKSVYTVRSGSLEEPEFDAYIKVKHPEDLHISGQASQRVDCAVLLQRDKYRYYVWLPYYNQATPAAGELDILASLASDASGMGKWFAFNKHQDVLLSADNDTAKLLYDYDAPTTEVEAFLTNHYGPLNVYFLASPSLVMTDHKGFVNKDPIEITADTGTVDMETIYLAGGLAPATDYAVTISAATDAQGNSVWDKLTAPGVTREDGVVNGTVGDLTAVGFTLNIENTKDTAAGLGADDAFGLNLIDFSDSYCEVRSSLTKDGTYTYLYGDGKEFLLAPEAQQVLTLPSGAVAGTSCWHQLVFHLALKDGENTWTVESDPFYLDTTSCGAGAYLSGYTKSYTADGSNWPMKIFDQTYEEDAQPAQLSVGLAPVPEGWSGEQTLTFDAKHQDNESKYQTDVTDLGNALKFRAYSYRDDHGAEHAPWVSFGRKYTNLSEHRTIDLTPVLAEEFTAEAYQEGVLPLSEGENIVCLQVQNANGRVTTTELPVRVSIKTPGSIAWQETNKTKDQVTLKPALSAQQALEDLTIGPISTTYDGETYGSGKASEYAFTAVASREMTFYVYDAAYGNLGHTTVNITGVDGKKPSVDVSSNYSSGTYYNRGMYYVTVEIGDDSVSLTDVPPLVMTFDAADSARILGKAVDGNTELVSVPVPICLERDQEGNFLDFVGFEPSNRGIFRTNISEFDEAAGKFTLRVWGVFPFDEAGTGVDADGKLEHSLTFSVTDKNGNVGTGSTGTVKVPNNAPDFSAWSLNEDGYLDATTYIPVAAIHSYGAEPTTVDFSQALYWEPVYHTALPMINRDGTYQLEYTDLFGNLRTQELTVGNVFGTGEVSLEPSETDYTNQDVTVTAMVKSTTGSIVSMTAVNESGNALADGVLGEPDGDGRVLSAYLVMPCNGKVTVTTTTNPATPEEDREQTFTLNVRNIDKTLAPAEIFFEYGGMAQPEFIVDNTVADEVTAVVSCQEFVTGVDGPLRYTFRAGSQAGDEHTFTYTDQAGNVGTLTATLPVNIQAAEEPQPEVVEDTTAPHYTVSAYAQRSEYTYQGNYTYYPGETDDTAALQQGAAQALNTVFRSYPARGYKLLFDVEDESAVKLLLRASGGAAPTSYDDTGDEVAGVTVSGHTVTVTKNNVTFDLYLVDEKGNVTPVTDLEVSALDNKAPEVSVRYKSMKDADGADILRSYFEVPSGEQIFVTDNRVQVELKQTDTGYESVYYYDHTKNGDFVFRYTDRYGNPGTATSKAMGFDDTPPIVNLVRWYGTPDNQAPDKVGADRKVNHDVTAEITVSKSVNNVALYAYDASKQDGMGEKLAEDGPVSVSWVGRKVTVTYADNVGQAIQVKIIANRQSVTQALPAVSCLDKAAPEVTQVTGTLADNKKSQSYTFKTNEPTTLAEGSTLSRTTPATSHTWTATQGGTVTLHFADKAGNVLNYPVTTQVDSLPLTLLFNKTAGGEGAKTEDKVSQLDLKAGDALYVSANKAAALQLGTDAERSVAKDEWTEFTLSTKSGFYVLKATDANTGDVTYVTLLVNKADTTPPVISFKTATLTLTQGMSAADMEAQARADVTVTDTDKTTTLTVTGIPAKAEKGFYTLTYTATDSSGNTSTATRTLYITAAETPAFTLNGQPSQPFGTTIIRGSTLEVAVNTHQPVVVKVKKGVKTGAQMKYGATTLSPDANGVRKAELDRGYYTVYIRTQDRQEVVVYVYRDA